VFGYLAAKEKSHEEKRGGDPGARIRKSGQHQRDKEADQMMKLFLSTVLLLLTGWTISPVLAFNNGAPTVECLNCHTEVGQQQTELKIEGLPKAYKAGATYQIRVVVDSTQESIGTVQGGFAVTASGGELQIVDRKHTQLSDGILTHTMEGANLRSWKLSWRAPQDQQKVEISIVAAAANGDYSPLGDPVAEKNFVVAAQ
jgi:hypothetical protein